MMDELRAAYSGRRVLLTGHTGFKGSWLALWLDRLGAQVHGFALAPQETPNLFDICRVGEHMDHVIGDIREYAATAARIAAVQPDIVLHLAAQPLVRQSYADPIATMATNVMGTAHVLEGVRTAGISCAVVVVSSDKCYDNHGWIWGYRENDALGGEDPYSASKGATELVAASWRDSFFTPESGVHLASARAGNVVGGGDWARDRIVPDTIAAFARGESVELRNPRATRPWQHVLEPLGGYLLLGARLLGHAAADYCEAWNFGPNARDVRPVEDLIGLLAQAWPGANAGWGLAPGTHPPEARALALNCDKAAARLDWHPTWSLEETMRQTASWYHAWHSGASDLRALTLSQIVAFETASEARQ